MLKALKAFGEDEPFYCVLTLSSMNRWIERVTFLSATDKFGAGKNIKNGLSRYYQFEYVWIFQQE